MTIERVMELKAKTDEYSCNEDDWYASMLIGQAALNIFNGILDDADASNAATELITKLENTTSFSQSDEVYAAELFASAAIQLVKDKVVV